MVSPIFIWSLNYVINDKNIIELIYDISNSFLEMKTREICRTESHGYRQYSTVLILTGYNKIVYKNGSVNS